MSEFEIGHRIDQYTITGLLGHGGMGAVYRARDGARARDVTLKFPLGDSLGDVATFERFSREIKIGKLLEHPHIQQFYEVGRERTDPYLVLEFVPGQSLRGVLQQRAAVPGMQDPPTMALAIGSQVGQALAYAHEHGVVHRDLKPENVIVTPDGAAKVTDFGIALVKGARRITWGPLSSQIGTPDYMAPEQVKGQRGDQRTDIYALGMMLYEIVAGRMPYEGDNAYAVMSQHVNGSPPPLSTFYSDVSSSLEEVVMKAMRRDPAARWASMREFVAALEHPEAVDVARLKAEREQAVAASARRDGRSFLSRWRLWPAALTLVAASATAGLASVVAP